MISNIDITKPATGAATTLSVRENFAAAKNEIEAIGLMAEVGTARASLILDQLALTNMRLMLNSAISTGNLVAGRQWELNLNEWASTSIGETFIQSAPNYYASGILISTNSIPVMTSNTTPSGVASADSAFNATYAAWRAFDSLINTPWGTTYSALPHWLCYEHATPKTITSYVITAVVGGTIGEAPKSWTFEAWNGAAWIILDTRTAQPAWTAGESRTFSFINTLSFAKYRLLISATANAVAPGVGYCQIGELNMQESVPATEMILMPPDAVTVSFAPAFVVVYFLWKDDSGTALLGVDLTVDITGNGGAAWVAAALSSVVSYDGTYSIIKARADISGALFSGMVLSTRISTYNGKAQRVAAISLFAE